MVSRMLLHFISLFQSGAPNSEGSFARPWKGRSVPCARYRSLACARKATAPPVAGRKFGRPAPPKPPISNGVFAESRALVVHSGGPVTRSSAVPPLRRRFCETQLEL